ncbi:MAG: hypothetical protein CMH55_01955 [Myxococcales bacterium]|nr:hypothetical protein [Myxococcales bacterium]
MSGCALPAKKTNLKDDPMRFASITLIALVAGAVLGAYFPSTGPVLALGGTLFVGALKALVLPIIFCSVVASMARLGAQGKIGGLLSVSFMYFLGTMIAAVSIGLVLVNLVAPGSGGELAALAGDAPNITGPSSPLAFLEAQAKKLVQDPIQAWSRNNILAILVFALAFGLALGKSGKGDGVASGFEVASDALGRLVTLVLYATPVGVFCLAAKQVAQTGWEPILKLGSYVLVVAGGLALHGLIVLPLVIWLVTKRSPLSFFRAALKPLTVAFATASSAATLPVTMEAAEEELDVPPTVSRVVLPLGATVNMDGTALYEAVAALFIANLYGIHLDFGAQLIVAVTACLAAIGAAGIPSAGLVTMALVLTAVGLPLEGIGMILAVDRFLDMMRTSVNVLGDLGGTVVVNRFAPVGSEDAVGEGGDA